MHSAKDRIKRLQRILDLTGMEAATEGPQQRQPGPFVGSQWVGSNHAWTQLRLHLAGTWPLAFVQFAERGHNDWCRSSSYTGHLCLFIVSI